MDKDDVTANYDLSAEKLYYKERITEAIRRVEKVLHKYDDIGLEYAVVIATQDNTDSPNTFVARVARTSHACDEFINEHMEDIVNQEGEETHIDKFIPDQKRNVVSISDKRNEAKRQELPEECFDFSGDGMLASVLHTCKSLLKACRDGVLQTAAVLYATSDGKSSPFIVYVDPLTPAQEWAVLTEKLKHTSEAVDISSEEVLRYELNQYIDSHKTKTNDEK